MNYREIKRESFAAARDRLLEYISPTGVTEVSLEEAIGCISAEDITAVLQSPPFDKSPYDGYALRSADTAGASKESPVELKVIYEIKAGDVPGRKLGEMEAVKILTGAKIPEGADCVVMYEKTEYDADSVKILGGMKPLQNIIKAGEDVERGSMLVPRGSLIDTARTGLIASQGINRVKVYRKLKVGIISTGSELAEPGDELSEGIIYNSNTYMFESEIKKLNQLPVYLGHAGDDTGAIAALLDRGLKTCDVVILTGGVSAGDYDLVPDAMEKSGVDILVYGIDMKPGMACAYGMSGDIPVIGLSGNPASSVTNYLAVALPLLKKKAGMSSHIPEMVELYLLKGFDKKSPMERLLRGKLVIKEGKACIDINADQGNIVIRSMAENNCMAIIPKGSGPVEAGTLLKGFMY